jgi:hypothetical protein
MPNSADKQVLAAARASVKNPLDFDEFLAKLSPKDRANAEKRVGVLDAEPDQRRVPPWQRLACALMTLAPTAKFVGKQTVQFYIPDGKYRMQVFALEDIQDGIMTVYCPNILDEVIKAGVLRPLEQGETHMYLIQPSGEPLRIEPLDKTAINPGAHFKDLLGWNRKALRITLPAFATPAQVETTELLCAVAAQHFVRTEPSAAVPAKRW